MRAAGRARGWRKARTLSRRWIRPTGNCRPARADREMGFFLSLSMALPPSVPFAPFPLRPLAPLPDMVDACVLGQAEKRFAGRLSLKFASKAACRPEHGFPP